MPLTTLTNGMTAAQMITALNNNMTFLNKKGLPVNFYDAMYQWEIASAFKINGFPDIDNYLGGANFLSHVNSRFAALNSAATTTVAGATDVKTVGATGDGSTDDAAAINAALVTGNILIQDGTFIVGSAISIPSNRTVYIYNAKIKRKNATYDNIFINTNINTSDTNIKIIGLGNAEICGNCQYCDDNYATYGPINVYGTCPPYRANVYKYIDIFLCNVDDFEVSNLMLTDMPHWFLAFQNCSNGTVHDLYHKRYRTSANQGYISIGYNSNNIDCYNIAGECRDDYFCFGAANYPGLYNTNFVGWQAGNVHDCNVYNVHIVDPTNFNDCFGSLNTIIAGDGMKVYNIDTRNAKVDNGGTLFYSSFSNYVDTPCAKTDFYNITMDNCELGAIGGNREAAYYFGSNMMNVAFTNMKTPLTSMRHKWTYGDQTDNVKINGNQIPQ